MSIVASTNTICVLSSSIGNYGFRNDRVLLQGFMTGKNENLTLVHTKVIGKKMKDKLSN